MSVREERNITLCMEKIKEQSLRVCMQYRLRLGRWLVAEDEELISDEIV